MAILKDKAYESAYSTEISNLIDKVTNREAFEYDPANDAAYKSLAKEYANQKNSVYFHNCNLL